MNKWNTGKTHLYQLHILVHVCLFFNINFFICSVILSQDLYVLAALIFLALNATQNAAMKSLAYVYQMKEVKIYDRNAIVSLAAIFIFFHVIFGIYIAFTVRIISCCKCITLLQMICWLTANTFHFAHPLYMYCIGYLSWILLI